MLQEIDRGRQKLRFLAGKMITIEEEERRRLAGDIHDTLAQDLTGMNYKLQFCKEILKKDPKLLRQNLDQLINMVNHVIMKSKQLCTNLRPDLIDTFGLSAALEKHIDTFMHDTGIRIICDLPREIESSTEVSICLFRVAQEALTNIYKHAKTGTAEVGLRMEDENLILSVTDMGEGFDISQDSFLLKDHDRLGLLSMRERVEAVGGSLLVDSAVNQGCRVEARVPI